MSRKAKPPRQRIPAPGQPWLMAIDPGPRESAWALFHLGKLYSHGKETSSAVEDRLSGFGGPAGFERVAIAIEYPQCYGTLVAPELFVTAEWVGRLGSYVPFTALIRVDRRDVKRHLLGKIAGNDSQIRSAIITLYGGKDVGIGTKQKPGPLYGVANDVWAAIAVGLTVLGGAAYAPRATPTPGASAPNDAPTPQTEGRKKST